MSNNRLQRQLDWANRRAKFAWAKYYQECNNQRQQALDFVLPLRENLNNNQLPEHLINQFRDLINKYKPKYECSICLEDISEGKTLEVVKCGHFFHNDCINAWLVNNDKCPLCRKKIKYN